MYKHYIRANEAGIIIHGFSDAFEQPQDGDICINEDAGRHFTLQLVDYLGFCKYKFVNGQLIEREQSELDAELAARPAPPPTVEQELADTKAVLAAVIAILNEKGITP